MADENTAATLGHLRLYGDLIFNSRDFLRAFKFAELAPILYRHRAFAHSDEISLLANDPPQKQTLADRTLLNRTQGGMRFPAIRAAVMG
jgi:hypothetical protein